MDAIRVLYLGQTPESSSIEALSSWGIGLHTCSSFFSATSIIFAKRSAELRLGPLKARAIIALTLFFFEMCRNRMLAENKGLHQ